MATLYTKVNKNCATCQFWGGERKTNFIKDKVEIKDTCKKGMCSKMRMEQLPSYNCTTKYEKWDQLA